VNGFWLAPWEIVLAALTLGLAFLGLGGGRKGRARRPPGRKRR
jgi:hypothetical protein